MRIRTIAAALTLMTAPCLAYSADTELTLPSFSHLKGRAIESIDVTIGRWPISLAANFIDADTDDAAAAKELLSGLQSISVRSYTFADENSYSKHDIDAVRKQLKSPQWMPLAQMHSSKDNSDVDIYISMNGDRPAGLAVVVTEPREFTILNIVGTVDPKNIGRIGKHFHLPQMAWDWSSGD